MARVLRGGAPALVPLMVAAFAMAATLTVGMSANAGDEVLASGHFVGKSRHIAEGAVNVKRTAEGVVVELAPSFSFDGAPDPKLGFGKGGYDPSTKFSPLRANDGGQTYPLPSSIDPANYDEIWIWCEKFAVPLGVAKLEHQ